MESEINNMRYQEEASKYIRVRDPDKEELSELVIRAKGLKRSMRQFAADIGVNASTLSRIVNMQTARANRDALIVSIAENADPKSGVTLDMLMKAHGMEKRPQGDGWENYKKFEQRCRMVIQDELLKRGYSVSVVPDVKARDGFRFDLYLKTDAVSHGSGVWAFEFRMMSPDPGISGIPTGMGRTERCVDRIMSSFYTGTAGADKVSVVVEHRAIFEQLKSRYSELCVPNEISFILISGDHISDEYVIPMKGRETKETFFTMKETDNSKQEV